MAAWLIATLECLPPRARRVVVAATAVLLLAGAITSLTLKANHRGGARWSKPTVRAQSQSTPAPLVPRRVGAPVSTADLRRVGRVASRFLASYLRFAYGRGTAGVVKTVSSGLRSQLITQRAQATPTERKRHPWVVSLATVGTTPGFVVATAMIEDGGVVAYRLRFTLREHTGRWFVSSVQEG